MKIAVIGSRTFKNWKLLESTLDRYSITQIISGGAKGADSLARRYAQEQSIELIEFLPDYSRFGRGAPLNRNIHIVESCDLVIAFWDGKSTGTAHSITQARKRGKTVVTVSI